MTTEQKIREAFEKEYGTPNEVLCEVTYWDQFDHFKAGYLTLLNELEPEMAITDRNFSTHLVEILYRLPEGVTKE